MEPFRQTDPYSTSKPYQATHITATDALLQADHSYQMSKMDNYSKEQQSYKSNKHAAIPNDRRVHITRLSLRVLSLLTAIAATGLIGNLIAWFKRTNNAWDTFGDNQWTFRVWPVGCEWSSPMLLAGAAAVAAVVSIVTLFLGFCTRVSVLHI